MKTLIELLLWLLSLSGTIWVVQTTCRSFQSINTLIKQLWLDEYQAHACGRALAGIANFHSFALQYDVEHPRQSELIRNVDRLIKNNITQAFQTEHQSAYQLTDHQCVHTQSGAAGVELYRFHRWKTSEVESNYSYKFIGSF